MISPVPSDKIAVLSNEHGTGATSPNWRQDDVSFVGNTLIVDLVHPQF